MNIDDIVMQTCDSILENCISNLDFHIIDVLDNNNLMLTKDRLSYIKNYMVCLNLIKDNEVIILPNVLKYVRLKKLKSFL